LKISIEPYNQDWPTKFKHEKEKISQAIGGIFRSIEHIGSTSVPGLAAKPTIDILIGVKNLSEVTPEIIQKIEQLGYDYVSKYESNMPERRFFRKVLKGKKTHHIHLVEVDSDFFKRHLLFRDYLRAHPKDARVYEELKHKLAKQFLDTNEYAKAKTEFVVSIEEKARKVQS